MLRNVTHKFNVTLCTEFVQIQKNYVKIKNLKMVFFVQQFIEEK